MNIARTILPAGASISSLALVACQEEKTAEAPGTPASNAEQSPAPAPAEKPSPGRPSLAGAEGKGSKILYSSHPR